MRITLYSIIHTLETHRYIGTRLLSPKFGSHTASQVQLLNPWLDLLEWSNFWLNWKVVTAIWAAINFQDHIHFHKSAAWMACKNLALLAISSRDQSQMMPYWTRHSWINCKFNLADFFYHFHFNHTKRVPHWILYGVFYGILCHCGKFSKEMYKYCHPNFTFSSSTFVLFCIGLIYLR